MKKNSLLLIVILLTTTSLLAQQMFHKAYGGPGDEYARHVIQTSDGGYLLSGNTTSFGHGLKDAYIVKTDSTGTQQWSKTFGGTGDDLATYAIEDNGTYVIGGITNSYGAGGMDDFLSRLDSAGNVIWFKTFGTQQNEDVILKFKKTFDAGFILACIYRTVTNKCCLVKVDSMGMHQWTKCYGGGQTHVAGDVVQSSDSGFLINGYLYPGIGNDLLVLKTDVSGNFEWDRVIGNPFDNEGGGYYITMVNDSEAFFVAEKSISGSTIGPGDLLLLKININTGDLAWANEYGKPGKSLRPLTGTPTKDNGFATDIYDYTNTPSRDMGILRTDSVGNILWAKKYGGAGDDVSFCIFNTSDNGFALGGYTTNTGTSDKDMYLVKTNAAGEANGFSCRESADTLQRIAYTALSASQVIPEPVLTDTNMNIIITAASAADSTIMYCATVGVTEAPANTEFTIYPNPSQSVFTITANRFSNSILSLYDLTGRLLLQQPFKEQATVDASALKAGMYVVVVRDKEGRGIKGKVVKAI